MVQPQQLLVPTKFYVAWQRVAGYQPLWDKDAVITRRGNASSADERRSALHSKVGFPLLMLKGWLVQERAALAATVTID